MPPIPRLLHQQSVSAVLGSSEMPTATSAEHSKHCQLNKPTEASSSRSEKRGDGSAPHQGHRSHDCKASQALFEKGMRLEQAAVATGQDLRVAVCAYKQAVDTSGHVGAMIRLAYILETGKGHIPHDIPGAVRYYQLAIEKGYTAEPFVRLALLLQRQSRGDCCAPLKTAISLYERAIDKYDDVNAIFCLAYVLQFGEPSTIRDCSRAAALYERLIGKIARDLTAAELRSLEPHDPKGSKCVPDEPRIVRGRVFKNLANRASYNLVMMITDEVPGVEISDSRKLELYESLVNYYEEPMILYGITDLLYHGGDGVEPDLDRAIGYCEKAVEIFGDVRAMHLLVSMYNSKALTHPEYHMRAVRLLDYIYKEFGDGDALIELAKIYIDGPFGMWMDLDTEKVRLQFEKAAYETNDAAAMHALALMLRDGSICIEPDEQRAVTLFEKAVMEKNYSPSKFYLASILEEGSEFIKQDVKRAITLYEQAIQEIGCFSASGRLLRVFEEGVDGVGRDVVRAANLLESMLDTSDYEQAGRDIVSFTENSKNVAELGSARIISLLEKSIEKCKCSHAMICLANILSSAPEHEIRDTKRAVEIYEQIINEDENGNVKYSLANLLIRGEDGVGQDVPRALSLYEQAVEKHFHVKSMKRLAEVFATGVEGTQGDPTNMEIAQPAGKTNETKVKRDPARAVVHYAQAYEYSKDQEMIVLVAKILLE